MSELVWFLNHLGDQDPPINLFLSLIFVLKVLAQFEMIIKSNLMQLSK